MSVRMSPRTARGVRTHTMTPSSCEGNMAARLRENHSLGSLNSLQPYVFLAFTRNWYFMKELSSAMIQYGSGNDWDVESSMIFLQYVYINVSID